MFPTLKLFKKIKKGLTAGDYRPFIVLHLFMRVFKEFMFDICGCVTCYHRPKKGWLYAVTFFVSFFRVPTRDVGNRL